MAFTAAGVLLALQIIAPTAFDVVLGGLALLMVWIAIRFT